MALQASILYSASQAARVPHKLHECLTLTKYYGVSQAAKVRHKLPTENLRAARVLTSCSA